MKMIINQRAVLNRLSTDLNNLAGESVEVKFIGDTIYALGSELATLRIYAKYTGVAKARHGFSENLKTYYFSLDLII